MLSYIIAFIVVAIALMTLIEERKTAQEMMVLSEEINNSKQMYNQVQTNITALQGATAHIIHYKRLVQDTLDYVANSMKF